MICRTVLFLAGLTYCFNAYANKNFYKDQIRSMSGQDTPKYEEKTGDNLWRIPLVEWAFNFSYSYKIPYDVVALTVEIFENLLIKKDIPLEDKSKYFSVCYALAVKVLHNDIRYDEIIKYSKNTNKSELVKIEKEICEILRWKLYYVIPHTYLAVIRNHLNERVGVDLSNYLVSTATLIAENELYHSKRNLNNYEITLNAIIRALNESKIHPADRDQIFVALNMILK